MTNTKKKSIRTMGLEPITKKGTDFKSAVYTIPPSAKKKKKSSRK